MKLYPGDNSVVFRRRERAQRGCPCASAGGGGEERHLRQRMPQAVERLAQAGAVYQIPEIKNLTGESENLTSRWDGKLLRQILRKTTNGKVSDCL